MFHRRCSNVFVILFYFVEQGPVVQGIVSLTNSLRAQLVKCFAALWQNTLKFLVRKAFAELLTVFNKNIGI